MITTGSMTMLAAPLGAVLALLIAWGGFRHLRRVLGTRCAPLEEALRVYSSANVTMGKHLTALESELHEMRQRLAAMGVTRVFGGGYCTASTPSLFYSFRKDKTAERMAALIWLA